MEIFLPCDLRSRLHALWMTLTDVEYRWIAVGREGSDDEGGDGEDDGDVDSDFSLLMYLSA